MMLPELFLPSLAGTVWEYSGIDSPDRCFDRDHFAAYPHNIQYCYNSRGFRDAEWPDHFDGVIWCVGDSFTHGLGVPQAHAWPAVLERRTGRRCMNISMDGASNNWIARTALAILKEFPTADVVLHWSFIHRRELDYQQALRKKFDFFYNSVRDSSWPDCELEQFDQLPQLIQKELVQVHKWNTEVYSNDRTIHYIESDQEQDIKNTIDCMESLPPRVTHSAIPNWAPPGIELGHSVIQINQVDLARDGYHYDIRTSQLLVSKVMSAWACGAND